MELLDLYDDDTLDRFIGIAVDEGKMDIKSFKKMLREYNSGERKIQKDNNAESTTLIIGTTATSELTRSCSYYENYAKEVLNA